MLHSAAKSERLATPTSSSSSVSADPHVRAARRGRFTGYAFPYCPCRPPTTVGTRSCRPFSRVGTAASPPPPPRHPCGAPACLFLPRSAVGLSSPSAGRRRGDACAADARTQERCRKDGATHGHTLEPLRKKTQESRSPREGQSRPQDRSGKLEDTLRPDTSGRHGAEVAGAVNNARAFRTPMIY